MDHRLKRLLDLLDATGEDTVNTSVRLPARLRDAAALAATMGLAGSTTELTVRGLRDTLEAFAQRAVLDAHPGLIRQRDRTSPRWRWRRPRSTATRSPSDQT